MAVQDLVVLVTGAARGMGREYVRGFLHAGAQVIATDLSWAPTGVSNDDTAFLDELQGNEHVLTEVMDITIDSHVRRVYQTALDRFGTVDVIVNNAGLRQRDLYPPHGSVTTLETEVGDWQKMFDTHVFGTLRVIKQFTLPMLAKRHGSLINVSSGGYNASRPDSREMPYQAAKGALVTMTLYLAHELKPHNIAANVLLPGHTRSTGSDEQEVLRREIRARTAAPGTPVRRSRRLNPDHVVPLALFLAAQDASGVTGQILSALQWNEEHGFGGTDRWGYAPDLEAANVHRPVRP
jgi:NAD(P)-dependent dehydrogenase (short-subunit alcohol dehydrogenase family)